MSKIKNNSKASKASLAALCAKAGTQSQNFEAVKPENNAADEKRLAITQIKPWLAVYRHKSESLVKTARVHQIANLNRTQSYMAMFPSLALLEETGNVYPASIDHHGNMTAGKYKSGAVVGHEVFNRVIAMTDEQEVTAAALYYDESFREAVNKLAGKPLSWPENNDNKSYQANVVSDCLRDLEAIGLVYCTNSNGKYWREFKKSTYRVNQAMRDVIAAHATDK